ncbi:TPA: DUF2219 domain-containing protein, partial [Citrobacter freundii]|nr:DUF2219 domain-containing protein [Citrobacter freundii]
MNKSLTSIGLFTMFLIAPVVQADSIALSVPNDDAGIFQTALNKIYSHKDEARDDYTQGLFLDYSHD